MTSISILSHALTKKNIISFYNEANNSITLGTSKNRSLCDFLVPEWTSVFHIIKIVRIYCALFDTDTEYQRLIWLARHVKTYLINSNIDIPRLREYLSTTDTVYIEDMPIRKSRIRYLNKLDRSHVKETKFAVSYGEAGFSINAETLSYMVYLKSPEAIKLLSERVPYNSTRDALNPHDPYYYPINVLTARAAQVNACYFWVTRDDPCLIAAIEHHQSMGIIPGHPKSDIVIEKIQVLPNERIFRRFINPMQAPPDSREYIVVGTPDEIVRLS